MDKRLLSVLMKVANSPGLLVVALAANVMVCGLIYAAIEHHGPIQGMWWAIVTGSTVGYGDQYPVTTPGRGLGAWLIVSSILLVAVGTAQLSSKLIVDRNVFSDEEQEEIKNYIREIHAWIKEQDGRGDGDRDLLHGQRVHPGPDAEAERRGAAFRREVSVAGRSDNPTDGRGPGEG